MDPEVRRAADRLLLQVARASGGWVAVIAGTTLISSAAVLALPYVIGHTVDVVFGGSDAAMWLAVCGLVVAVRVGATVATGLAAGLAVARSTAWLRHRLLGHVLAVGPRSALGLGSGEISSRLVGNTAEAGRIAPDVVRSATGVVPALGGIVALAVIDPWLCLTFLVGMPFFFVFLRVFARDASQQAMSYFKAQGMLASRLVDALAGARTIAAAGSAEQEVERVLAPLPELHRQGLAQWRSQMNISTQDLVLVSLLEIAVLAVAGAELAAGRITPGELLMASQYVLLAVGVGSAVSFVTRLARSRGAAARIVEVLDQQPMQYGTQRLAAGPGRIEFHDVTVRDGDKPVLQHVDLVVEGGSLVAIVGSSGSGKSLLAALAGRLVDPDEGEVLLDGMALPSLSRDELRQAVGFGFERPVLLGETLEDVIAFADHEPSPDELLAAAVAAQADGFIRHMPDGYDTLLENTPMSGGEVQRVGLARAFARARRLLVLDDVAASLDTVTEHQISQVLTGELADRTRIVVAHRASTAARADAVVWLDDAGVRATATHHELWQDRNYRALFEPEEHAPRALAGVATNGSVR
ncbi:MAG: ATP-binding cassette, subfamily bacterial RamA/AmfB [Solirubrobacteraceae bacterium]|jgi:ATP-binding cassette subfamily B protein|nr:ATP-binding cassette, subfamily bacterial RamA/AmfB [Solirubrobacteraceae bacterium]